MFFVTQGTIKVSLGAITKFKVCPVNEYRVTHKKATYTVFVAAACGAFDRQRSADRLNCPDARCFEEDHFLTWMIIFLNWIRRFYLALLN